MIEVSKKPTAYQQLIETNWEEAYNCSLELESSVEPADIRMQEREKTLSKLKKIKKY